MTWKEKSFCLTFSQPETYEQLMMGYESDCKIEKKDIWLKFIDNEYKIN